MRQSIFSAMFGARSNEIRMNMISNNLANVNTTGFKKENVAFHDTFLRFAHDYMVDATTYIREENPFPEAHLMARPRLSDQETDFSQGSLQETNNALDFALVGDGFFKVRTPDGDFLTRSGSFQLSGDGTLITEQGYEVLGSGGPVVLPSGSVPEVDTAGNIRVDGAVIATLDLATVADKTQLEKLGNNLFGIKGDEPEVQANEVTVEQGRLERGNVNVVEEMVAMIDTQRVHSLYQKMISGTTDMDQSMIQKVGQIR